MQVVEGEISACTPEFEPRGSAGTRNPTFGAPGRGAPESIFYHFVSRCVVITMSGDQAGNPDPWAAWPARAEPLASGDPVPQAARGPQGAAAAGDADRLRQLSHRGRHGRQQGPPITPRPRHRTPAGSRRTRGPRSWWPKSCCSAGCWRAAVTCCWSGWQSSWASPPRGLTPSAPSSHL